MYAVLRFGKLFRTFVSQQIFVIERFHNAPLFFEQMAILCFDFKLQYPVRHSAHVRTSTWTQ